MTQVSPNPPSLRQPFHQKPWKYRLKVYARRHRPLLRRVDRGVSMLGVGITVFYLWLVCFILAASLMAAAFKWAGNNDGFAVIQAFGFLATLVTLLISAFNHPTLKRAGLVLGIGTLGLDQAGDLTQKFFEGSAPFKDQAVQLFLWLEIGSGATILATAAVLIFLGLKSSFYWLKAKLNPIGGTP